MHVNLFIYDYTNDNVLDIFEFIKSIENKFAIKLNKIDYLYKLSEEKSDHSGDFKSKKISEKKLIEGIKNGEIDSFNLANTADLRDSGGYFIYVNSENYGGTSNITLHFPISSEVDFEGISDALVQKVGAGYAFQMKSESALKGVGYTLASTIYKNERGNFSSYLMKNKKINQPRMIYYKNFLTKNQLDFMSNGIALRDFIASNFQEIPLVELCEDIFIFKISLDKIVEVNNLLGEAGFLISWVEIRKNR